MGLHDGVPVGWWLLQPPTRPDQGPVEGQAELGFVTTDPLPANAQAFSITTLAATPATWSILDPSTKKGTPLAYILGSQMPLLTYAPPPAQPGTLLAEPVTPGYAALAQGKGGQKADLRHCDLSGLDLSGVDFTGDDFTVIASSDQPYSKMSRYCF